MKKETDYLYEEYKNRKINKFGKMLYQICVGVILVTITQSLAEDSIIRFKKDFHYLGNIIQTLITFSCIMVANPLAKLLIKIDYEN